ncbi:Lecithin-cholesterol acyltransferase-like 1 [Dichanthelium oligosanthes]|uniref:Lecithin-cholesterol acyltransferase-like 1 n=1 Tax=Dichanthelium oligosanthes TaxID=888268 RepID=A0A1E5WMV6_9POAL|nr:Lecithin-cholesterol acyltransferase-like 1 [Dichanthelium oligosanthes]
MDVQLHRLLPLLFLLSWPFFLRGNRNTVRDDAADLHPIVLLPGHTCSQLLARLTDEYEPAAAPSCGAQKGKGWFRLWENYTALQDPDLLPCYAEQLRVVYDPVARDYRDTKGVEVRVMSFGTTRGFGSDNPGRKNDCMRRLVDALEGIGYKDGENLFGAPYDLRYAPAPPGQPALQFSYFLSSLRRLIECASERNGNKPVILVTHSHGGMNAIEFLNRNTLQWRRRYVKHFVMVGMGGGGGVSSLRGHASAIGRRPPPPSDILVGNTGRSFASVFITLPSPAVFGHAPLVITRAKNYSAYDMPEFLKAVGFSDDQVARYRTRDLPVTLNLFRAPIVPMTCINAVGARTVERLVYWDGDFSTKPEVVYGDGDGAINLVSFLALDTMIGDDPDQKYYKSVLIPNTSHGGLMKDDFALERVVREILEANGASASY